ncbi:MAG: hypothetical protein U0556_10955 [Dehalococcoidia bacterium]
MEPAVENYQWSADNSAEIEGLDRQGQSTSIRELAVKIGRSPAAVEATVVGQCLRRRGRDLEFGRSADQMSPIVKPPFYAAEIDAAIVVTTGGGVRERPLPGGQHRRSADPPAL